MGYSAMPGQAVTQKKDARKDLNAVEEDYTRATSMGNTLNINRYYLVLIGRSLELYGTIRLYENSNSLHYFEQQLEYLGYTFDTMSPKIKDEEYDKIDKLFDEIYAIKETALILGYEGEAKFLKIKEASQLKQKIRKLYRTILAVLDEHDMLTFKDLEPSEVLSGFGE